MSQGATPSLSSSTATAGRRVALDVGVLESLLDIADEQQQQDASKKKGKDEREKLQETRLGGPTTTRGSFGIPTSTRPRDRDAAIKRDMKVAHENTVQAGRVDRMAKEKSLHVLQDDNALKNDMRIVKPATKDVDKNAKTAKDLEEDELDKKKTAAFGSTSTSKEVDVDDLEMAILASTAGDDNQHGNQDTARQTQNHRGPVPAVALSTNSSVLRNVMPLPGSDRDGTNEQSSPQPPAQSTPGAHPVFPTGYVASEEEEESWMAFGSEFDEGEQRGEEEPSPMPLAPGDDDEDANDVLSPLPRQTSNNSGLVVANPIDELSTDFRPDLDLPRAEQQEVGPFGSTSLRASGQQQHHHHHQQQQEKMPQKAFLLGMASLLLLVLVIILLVLLPRSSNNNNVSAHDNSQQPSLMPSIAPSQAPTTYQEYLLSLLPTDTMKSILVEDGDANSPQAMAFEWLLEDVVDYEAVAWDDEKRIQQRYALATLYFATGGDTWANNQHWLNHTVHECDWYMKPDLALKDVLQWVYPGYLAEFPGPFEKCSQEEGLYQHLWLDQNNLVGSIPPEVFMLTSLQTFTLGFNRLFGSIPTLLGQLTQLEGTYLSFIQKAGEIPSEIGLLSNLRGLGLQDNNHVGTVPTELWLLTNLQSWGMSRNPELDITIPTEISTLSKLRWLTFDECNVTGTLPTEIGELGLLEYLFLHENMLSGSLPSEIGQMSQTVILSTYGNGLSGALPTELGLLTFSALLSLGDNNFSGRLPSQLGLLTNLQVSLLLRNNSFTGQIPSELGLLSKLGELSLQNNNFSGPVSSQLYSPGSVLHTLNVKGNPLLSGTVPTVLCGINGTCIPNGLDPCKPPFGFAFDCSDILCGCSCPCLP